MKNALKVALGALCLCLVANLAVAASDDGFEPAAIDFEIVQGCLEDSRGNDQWSIARDCIGVIAKPCLSIASNQTTHGMVGCNWQESQVWDSLLNDWYGSAREHLSGDLKRQLRDVQRAWIKWRDAKCGFERDMMLGGTLGSVASAACAMETTAIRALELHFLVMEYESR